MNELEQLTDRQRDALLAEHVMGWEDVHAYRPKSWVGIPSFMTQEVPGEYYCRMPAGVMDGETVIANLPIPALSSTWEGMGMVVEAMAAKGYHCTMIVFPDGQASVDFFIQGTEWTATADKETPRGEGRVGD